MSEMELARSQHLSAEHGEAVNQCPSCGVYRPDGAEPILHRPDCELVEGWRPPAEYFDADEYRRWRLGLDPKPEPIRRREGVRDGLESF